MQHRLGGFLKSLEHIAFAIHFRLLLLHEYLYVKSRDGNAVKSLGCLIWRQPDHAEDLLHFARLISVTENIVLIDIGANVGSWAERFVSMFPNTKLIAFEPDERAFSQLNVRFKDRTDTKLYQYAASSVDKELVFKRASDTTYSTFEEYSIPTEGKTDFIEEIVIEARAIDNLDLKLKDQDITVLKIDVQGHEIEVLEGAKNTLENIDFVFAELSVRQEYSDHAPSFTAASTLLADAGLYPVLFQSYGKQLGPHPIEFDVLFAREPTMKRLSGWLS